METSVVWPHTKVVEQPGSQSTAVNRTVMNGRNLHPRLIILTLYSTGRGPSSLLTKANLSVEN